MSAPFKRYEDPLRGAVGELVSAESGLNMPPKPKEHPSEGAEYLSQLDEWAEHAMEHLHEVFALLQKVELRVNRLHGLELYVEALLDPYNRDTDGRITLKRSTVENLERAMKGLRQVRPWPRIEPDPGSRGCDHCGGKLEGTLCLTSGMPEPLCDVPPRS